MSQQIVMGQRFTDRELTAQEQIYLERMKAKSFEALICFMESRQIDPELDFRNMPVSQIEPYMHECMDTAKTNPLNVGGANFFDLNDTIG